MKHTGIVRRMDDLGRIVIPKEIRRTLRVREGDPLEIYIDSSGNIIFKKYSAIKEISSFATRYADILSQKIELPVLVSDCEHIVAVSYAPKKEFLGRRITRPVEEIMQSRTYFSSQSTPTKKLLPMEEIEDEAFCVYPIICAGDIIGSVCVLKNEKKPLTKHDKIFKTHLAEITAKFLGTHFED